jgi:hypothetical protein
MRATAEEYEALALQELKEAASAGLMDQLKHVGRAQTYAHLALVSATKDSLPWFPIGALVRFTYLTDDSLTGKIIERGPSGYCIMVDGETRWISRDKVVEMWDGS